MLGQRNEECMARPWEKEMVAEVLVVRSPPEAGRVGMTTSPRLIVLPTSKVRNINFVQVNLM